uniref:Uncharacterized protein n=1 Tax=Arundo donax TaxID=35708 RepID=A0A0A9C8Z4_ARUDO
MILVWHQATNAVPWKELATGNLRIETFGMGVGKT